MALDTPRADAPVSPDELLLHTYAEDAYLDYAMAVVKDRALVQVQDGNKPVHRRILYAMRQLGLSADAKAVKSARIVGDVLGKYHPHGDTAAYDALVRLAQPFALRYPLITGQGNFGSRDGDGAAAMRYTEAKLAPVASLLLDELGAGTVDFKPNYDGSQQEPRLLPARLPFTLLNGTMGIAVGMASNTPPHNLREVVAAATALIDNPEMEVAAVLSHMPGPDFPDGGQLISAPSEIEAAYRTGRGSLRLRARWSREDLARGQWQIVVHELPYQVSTRQVLEQIETLTNPQPGAGKKALTQQQINLKSIALDLLERASDESGKDAAVRLVLAPRTSKVDEHALMAFLLANTSLEETFGVNATMIGADDKPATKGVVTVLREWCAFRVETVRRRTQWELDQALKRIHLLEGRMTVYLNIDRVVHVVRTADDPHADLRAEFGLSDVQAADILEMRLRALNKLEGLRIDKELQERKQDAARLGLLLADSVALRGQVKLELAADAAKFGDDRRTLIEPQARASSVATVTRAVLDEPLTVVVSRNLWVRARPGHGVSTEALSYKPADSAWVVADTRSTWPVIFLDNKGRVYSVLASEFPSGKGDGVPLSTLIEVQPGAQIVDVLVASPSQRLLFAGRKGYGFTAQVQDCVASRKAGKAFLTLEAGEDPMPVTLLPEQGPGKVGVGSSDGRFLAFEGSEIKSLPSGGKGVMLMVLEEGQSLTGLAPLTSAELKASLDLAGKALGVHIRGAEWAKYEGRRARKGCQLPKKAVWRGR